MALADELESVSSGGNLIVSTSMENYEKLWTDTVGFFDKRGDSGTILSINKSYIALGKLLESKKIDCKRLSFIDCISSNEEKREGNCIYLERPFNPTYVSIVMEPPIKDEKTKFFIFDSLSSFMMYQPLTIVKFFHFTLSQLAANNKIGLIFDVDIDTTNASVKSISQACDRLVKL